MFEKHNYHGIVRKYAQIFSALFSDLTIIRENKQTHKAEQVITVPIGYAPRAQWIQRITQDPTFRQKVATQLPRLSFEMTSLTRDSSRAIVPIQYNARDTADRENRFKQFVQTPYNMGFQLSLITNDEDDAWQVLEQICPYFQPELTFNTNLVTDMQYAHNVVIVLDGLRLSQPYEGTLEERRIISWDLDFTLKGYIYGPVERQGLIKKSIARLRIPTGHDLISLDDILNTPPAEVYTVCGGLTADGQPTFDVNESIPYDRIKATDNYALIEQWDRINTGQTSVNGSLRNGQTPVEVIAGFYWAESEW